MNLLAALAVGLGMMTGITGAAGQGQGIERTTAGECVLEPVTIPLFGGTPAAVIAATPAASPEPAVAAAPVNEATIREAASMIVACINTGDPSFAYAVFTPRYLASQFVDGAGHYQPEFEFRLASPSAPVTPTFTLEAVEGLEQRSSGRVEVTLVLRSEQASFRDTLLLANVDGRWLIDEVVALDPSP